MPAGQSRSMRARRLVVAVAILAALPAAAQTLRFDSDRPFAIPENANIRLGDVFYSDLAWSQSLGYRYVRTAGPGAGSLFSAGRGQITEDGSDFPIISALHVRNGLLLGSSTEVDLSFTMQYAYYPLGTEDDNFQFTMVDLGLYSRMGAFTFALTKDYWQGAFNGGYGQAYVGSQGAGALGVFQVSFAPTPFFQGRLYDQPSYRVMYLDDRGLVDNFSGQKYRAFENTAGIDTGWLLAKDKNVTAGFSRVDTLPQGQAYRNLRSAVYNGNVGYNQQVNPLLMAGARADYAWTRYTASGASRGDQFQQDYTTFANFDLTDLTTLRLDAGVSRVKLTNPSAFENAGSSDTVVGSAGINSQISKHLAHALSFSRTQSRGFQAGAEIVNLGSYQLSWNSDMLSASVATALRDVSTRLSSVPGYRDWLTQLNLSHPLTEHINLYGSTAYSVRLNGSVAAGGFGTGQPYLQDDYDTWVSTLGIGYTILPGLVLSSYVEHLNRFSSGSQLEYTQDTFEVDLAYSYDF